MKPWFDFFRSQLTREDGQTMAEYGVVLAVVTILAVGAFELLGSGIAEAIERVIGLLPVS